MIAKLVIKKKGQNTIFKTERLLSKIVVALQMKKKQSNLFWSNFQVILRLLKAVDLLMGL